MSCELCKSPSSSYCTGCKCTSYCGEICQKKDWPRHKSECKKLISYQNQALKALKSTWKNNNNNNESFDENVRVKESNFPLLGKVLEATKNFEIGELVLSEVPLVMFPCHEDSSVELISLFAAYLLRFLLYILQLMLMDSTKI